MNRNKLAVFPLIGLLIAAGCQQPTTKEKEQVVEAQTKEPVKTPAVPEATQTSGKAEEVSSIPTEFDVKQEGWDPDGVYKRNPDEAKEALMGEGLILTGHPQYRKQIDIAGNDTQKRVYVLETFWYETATDTKSGQPEKVTRFTLFQAVIGDGSVQKSLQPIQRIEKVTDMDGRLLEFRTLDTPVPEKNEMELHDIVLKGERLHFVFADKKSDYPSGPADSVEVVPMDIQPDGSLKEAKETYSFKGEVSHSDNYIPTTKGLAAYSYPDEFHMMDGSNEVKRYAAYTGSGFGKALFFDDRKDVLIYWIDERLTYYDMKNQKELQPQNGIVSMDYKEISVAGFDEETGYLYILGLEHTDHGNLASVHVLDENYNDVAGTTSVYTNTAEVSETENGFILWGEEGEDVPIFRSSKVTFVQ